MGEFKMYTYHIGCQFLFPASGEEDIFSNEI